ncbi:Squalene cyclase, N-terminal [Trema orientale]|uniref:Squalene cyclase, N-terminal n=1 Tax=Trema orientale TaxID=63057 RepID=A0A2P5E765_TREOI|nr:Squalene cyclase, N-terminal [Trema orientale]
MWKLKIAEGGNPWLRSVNNHVGRQLWEFHPNLGSPEELAQIEDVRQAFAATRFQKKHSSDLLMRIQLSKENPNPNPNPNTNPNGSEMLLGQVKVKETEDVTDDVVTITLKRALNFYSTIQAHDGHWPGDYGGPMFLLPGLVITLSITGALNAVLSEEHKKEMRRYIYNHQNQDGGWGLHIEGSSTMFGSVLSYVTLRLLGEEANDGQGAMEKGRKWILDHGGATAITSWGKMWLSVLGVFEWSGNNPLPPEIWLLPYLLPVHPGSLYLPITHFNFSLFTHLQILLLLRIYHLFFHKMFFLISYFYENNTGTRPHTRSSE